jgi:hypothetical protein
MHTHRARAVSSPNVKTRIAVAEANANRHREIKPVTLAEMPWESTKEEDECTK